MSRIVINNFLNGMVSSRMRRRADSNVYHSSARLMQNLLPIKTGGFTLREGTVSEKDDIDADRIIPFIKSVTERYILAYRNLQVEIYAYDITLGAFRYVEVWDSPYTEEEIQEIQYTQDYERLVTVQGNHTPYVFTCKPSAQFESGYEIYYKPIQLDTETSASTADKKYDYNYKTEIGTDFNADGDYPRCVAFCSNRLWFASSVNAPYTIWGSQPFTYNNFQKEEYYSYVNEEATVQQYMDAVSGGSEQKGEVQSDGSFILVRTELLFDDKGKPTGMLRKITEKHTPTGSGDYTVTVIEDKNVNYSTPITQWNKTVTERCALILEVGSDRNEAIQWISASGDITIGTSSSEWIIPRGIDALNQQIYPISAYGSVEHQNAIRCAGGIFYIQSGGKKLRGLMGGSGGYQNLDMCYYCNDILDAGVRELHWRRVPEQRCYCLLKNGTIAVLSYDPSYGMNAWTVNTYDGQVLSMCVMDTQDGQDVYILTERSGIRYLERFDDTKQNDNNGRNTFIGVLETNGIDVMDTISYNKGVNTVYVDSSGCEFRVGQKGAHIERASKTNNMTKVGTFTKHTNDELILRIESIEGFPLEVLALITEVSA